MKTTLRGCLILLALCLLLPAASLAQTQAEFNATCTKMLAADCSVFPEADAVGIPIGKLPANTCVHVLASGSGTWIQIDYFSNGEVVTGWVDGMVKNYNPNKPPSGGARSNANTTDASGAAALPNLADIAGATGVDVTIGKRPATSKAGAAGARYQSQDGNTLGVTIVALGTYRSTVKLGNQEAMVATSDLVFSEDVPDDKRIAVVYAPRTGKVSLRATASNKGKVLTSKCAAGAVVPILAIEGDFALLHYGKYIGYTHTDNLKFYAPVTEILGEGLISYKGKTNGRSTINIRGTASKSGPAVAKWKTGVPVVVFSLNDDWYEIEAKGVRGFVMEEFLVMQK